MTNAGNAANRKRSKIHIFRAGEIPGEIICWVSHPVGCSDQNRIFFSRFSTPYFRRNIPLRTITVRVGIIFGLVNLPDENNYHGETIFFQNDSAPPPNHLGNPVVSVCNKFSSLAPLDAQKISLIYELEKAHKC